MAETEAGWYPDYLYRNGRFVSGVAFFAGANGLITRFSSDEDDLRRASRLRDAAIIPGLVNAHSHAFQRAIRGRVEERSGAAHDSFWTWREAMYRAASELTPEDLFAVARMAFLEMLAAGITTVGEFHYLHHEPDGTRYADPNLLPKTVIRAAQETGLRIVLLKTAYARAGWQKEPDPRQRRFITSDAEAFLRDTEALCRATKDFANGMVSVGLAPHSVRAVPLAYLRECARFASERALPLHMHVAEQPAEIEACLAEYGRRPVELLAENGVLAANFTAVHATHTTEDEITQLADAQSTICVCPTTERNLGDGIADADLWHAKRVNVCFGSDSNAHIDLLEDARELEYHLRLKKLARAILPALELLDDATRSGAYSLRVNAGELETGKAADFCAIDLNHLSIAGSDAASLPAQLVFAAQRGAVRDVYVAGKRAVEDRQHAEQSAVIEEFARVQRSLWSR